MSDPILIIGAGIGGLACARALKTAGFEARVLERATELSEVGAGLGLWTNAVRCLRRLGVDEAFFREHGCAVLRGEAATHDGRVLSRFDLSSIAEEFGAQSYVVHRAELHAALAAAVDPELVTLGAACVGLEEDEAGVTVRFEDGSEARGSMVIGCDGLRSAVRAALFGDVPPRYAGETCYRGVARHAVEDLHTLREVQGRGVPGRGVRCAVCPIGPERVYWWATERAPEGTVDDPATRKARLAELFRGSRFGFPEALEATDDDAILKNDLYDRDPIPRWSRGRVTLLGDAAHPTTPNLGQGACMAIEDAVVLARCVAEAKGDHAAAFARYERERRTRCYDIVKKSRVFGRVGSWSNPVAVAFRDLVNWSTPSFVLDRVMRQQLGYDAGPIPTA